MPSMVLDTHAAIWYLETSPNLSPTVDTAVRAAIAAGDPVWISSVTLVEVTYLVEKGRFAPTLLDRLVDLVRQPLSGFRVAVFDLDCAVTLRSVSSSIRDMPDRMIVATAVTLGLPLATRDQQVRTSGIPTLW